MSTRHHIAEPVKLPSYASSQGHPDFDWWDFLNRAEAGEITVKQFYDALNLAADWVTCATGAQCSLLSRDKAGAPNDGKLLDLSLVFLRNVRKHDFSEARNTLRAIEARSAFLLSQL